MPEELLSAVDEGFAAVVFLGWLDDLHLVKYAKSRMMKWKGRQKIPVRIGVGNGLSYFAGVTVACRGDLESVYMTVGWDIVFRIGMTGAISGA